jgi:DNA-directed RNA polymerase subunit RPC12/RpoP
MELDLGKTTTHACPHCGQTVLSVKEALSVQVCGRCGKPMKEEPKPTPNDMVRFQCEGCNKRLKAPSYAAGKKATCKRCGQCVRVPTASANSSPFILAT